MSRSPVRVGVVGSVNQDAIVQADGSTSSGLGGVLFTAGALDRLGAPHGIQPVLLARVGRTQKPMIVGHRRLYPGLCLQSLRTSPGEGFHCRIRYDATGAKEEILLGALPPLTIRELAPDLRRLQALVVNFITGFELDLETLRAARRVVHGLLLVDLHSLLLARDADGRRRPRCLPHWRSWLAAADVIQMNQTEAALLGAGTGFGGAAAFARQALAFGPKGVIVTLGAAGAVGAWRAKDGRVTTVRQAAIPTGRPAVDPTGCGDVFLAGLAVGLLKGGTVHSAMHLGATAAARKCTRNSLDGLLELNADTLAVRKV